jgi:hypothetical protein
MNLASSSIMAMFFSVLLCTMQPIVFKQATIRKVHERLPDDRDEHRPSFYGCAALMMCYAIATGQCPRPDPPRKGSKMIQELSPAAALAGRLASVCFGAFSPLRLLRSVSSVHRNRWSPRASETTRRGESVVGGAAGSGLRIPVAFCRRPRSPSF